MQCSDYLKTMGLLEMHIEPPVKDCFITDLALPRSQIDKEIDNSKAAIRDPDRFREFFLLPEPD